MKANGYKTVIMVAWLLGSLSWLSPSQGWAITQGLKGIELNASPNETKILLRAEYQIPFQVMSYSPEKIIVDLSAVDPAQSIQTDFTAADNINQVLIKPMGGQKIRMIIRGEHLASPVVINKPTTVVKRRHAETVLEAEADPLAANEAPDLSSKTDNSGYALTALDGKALNNDSSGSETENQKDMPEQTAVEDNTETSDLTTDTENENEPVTPIIAEDRKPLIDPGMAEENITVDTENNNEWGIMTSLGDTAGAVARKIGTHMNAGIVFALCAVIGLSILLILNLRKIGLKRQLVRKKAKKAYPGEGSGWEEPSESRHPFQQEDLRNPKFARMEGRPVGLKSLWQQVNDLETIPTVSQNQAIQEYARQALPPQQEIPKRQSHVIDNELRRSLHMKRAIESSYTPKQTTTGTGGYKPLPSLSQSRQGINPTQARGAKPGVKPMTQKPMAKSKDLPGSNPEVLDFLRSVADMMDSDGQNPTKQK